MMFGFAVAVVGVGEAVGVEGEVRPDPPHAAPKRAVASAARRVRRSFTGRIVAHRPCRSGFPSTPPRVFRA